MMVQLRTIALGIVLVMGSDRNTPYLKYFENLAIGPVI
jgi:hypothetical protein